MNYREEKIRENEEYMALKLEKDLKDFEEEMAKIDAEELLERFKIAVVEQNANFLISAWREKNGKFFDIIEAEVLKRIGGNQ
jgi:hypothetical protein